MDARWRISRSLLMTVLVIVAALAACVATTTAAKKPKRKATAPAAAFCVSPVVDDYLAPLAKLQPLPAVPTGGVLGFAPAGTTLSPTGPRLLVGASSVGFRLTAAAPAGPTPRRLNWVVLERLIRLTKEGTRLHPAGLKRLDLAQLPPGKHRGLTFQVPATPAIYSLEVTIQDHRGRLLGRYGEYLRVVGRVANAGITLAAYDNVVPGSYLESCFENHGTASVTPGSAGLERFDGGTWRPVVVGPQYTPAPTPIPRTLGPGEAERIATLIPPNALPGLYRLTAPGIVVDTGEPFALGAEFGVL